MTKINKLGKSTFVIAILSFLLVAVLAFGGTYAYFSAQAKTVSGTITTGHLRIGSEDHTGVYGGAVASEKLTIDAKIAQPNQTVINDTFSVDVNSNIAYYTRVKFTVSVETAGHEHTTKDADEVDVKCLDKFTSALDALTIGTIKSGETEANVENDNAGWLAGAESAAAGSATSASTSKYFYKLKATRPTPGTANAAVKSTETFKVVVKVNPEVGSTVLVSDEDTGSAAGCAYWMDAEITISISFEVLQADYLNASEGDGVTAVDFTTGEQAETAWNKALTGEQGTKPAA